MKKLYYFLVSIFAILLVLLFFFPKFLSFLPSFGRGAVDEYCVECGLFQRTSYFSMFGQTILIEHQPGEKNGLAVLHDSFFEPCKEHKMFVYHVLRNSAGSYGHSVPRPKVGFDEFKNCDSENARKFAKNRPELAKKVTAEIFKLAKSGDENISFYRWKQIIDFQEMMLDHEIEEALNKLAE